MTVAFRPAPSVVRRDAGLYGYERALTRRGLGPVAGVDEAGRGACAGPLVVAAVVLGHRIDGLNDSKLLTAARREQLYGMITTAAEAVSVVVIPPAEIDARGLHRSNIEGMRRAVARLPGEPGYVLTDGFPVPGLPVPSLGVWKGDQVAACVAAASIVAKVTRDRMMTALDGHHPEYGFAAHKGYGTVSHRRALKAHGPCPAHRFSFATVARSGSGEVMGENEVGAGPT
ncbi:ribonuclease HII [Streptosporangium sp. NBC_01639]|uniref:ribonuclease HII n=1 Tax=unclassified Streptosporangium TaxID=2632669 RepID=UPI002DD96D74|nr:ribonuclease HII [Streptosporangium sp. NBC_01756]WSC84209.1 ribonuclease HII [Streptosporangium sp. NBC_01756]WTD57174.1 ribonuclease HII [Streptosporangium sp. NBC_01639]